MRRHYIIKNFSRREKFSQVVKTLAATCLLLTIVLSGLCQSVGDYRSNANGNWSSLTTWQRYSGSGWSTPSSGQGYPGQFASSSTARVNVRDNVTLNISPANSIASLDVTNQSNLTTSGNPNLVITGNLHLVSDWTWFIVSIPLPSSCSFGNGNISVGGDLTIDAGGTFNFGTGVYTSPGRVIVDVGDFGLFQAVFENNGTVNLSNTSVAVLSGGGQWTQGINSTLNYAGSTLTVETLSAASSGNLVNYNRGGNQTINATTYHHISLVNSGSKTAGGSFTVGGDFEISGSASFAAGTSTVTLNGSVAQNLTTTGSGITFNNLVINNSFGVSPQITTGGNITVSSVLTMTRGNVNLNGNTFNLTSTAAGALSHNFAASSGWMYGGSFVRVRPGSTTISVNDARSLFPLGSQWDWRPFFVGQDNVAAAAGTMTVTHTNSTSTSDVTINDTSPAAMITRRHNSHWTPETTATGGTYTLRAGGTNFGTISSASHLRMATSTGVVGSHAAGSGGPTDWRVNRNNVSRAQLNANNFHLASINPSNNSPLPIELLSFSAQLKNSEVELKWSTASETNNNYFTIERASNLEHFEAIIEEDGKGTSKELNHYKAIDYTPLYGRSYYRLKQTDFDGKFSYSPVQVINYEGPVYATLSATPNPLKGSPLTIRVEGLKETKLVPVQILNIHGQKVYEKVFEVKTPGTLSEEIPAHLFPASGLYIIKAGKTLYLTRKIVVE